MQAQASHKRTTATFIGLIAPLLWSTYPALTLMIGKMPAFQLLTIGFGVSFFMSLIIWKIRKQSVLSILKQPLKYWAIGIFGILGFNSFYITALYHAPAAEAFLLTSIWPLLALILDAILLKERLRTNHIIGCLLGFSGIFCIAINKGMSVPDSDHIIGYAAAFTAACIWASYSLLLKRNPFPKPEFIGGICGASAIGTAILHFLLESNVPVVSEQILPLILMGAGSLGISYYCWNYGTQYGDLRALSSLVFLGHFSTIGLLMLSGHATLTSMLVIAFTLIISGAFVGSMGLFAKPK